MGRLVAAWTSATIRAEVDGLVISHGTATFCIQVSKFETKEAIQGQRNSGRANVDGPTPVIAASGSAPAPPPVSSNVFRSVISRRRLRNTASYGLVQPGSSFLVE